MKLSQSYARFLNLMRAFSEDNPDPEINMCLDILARIAETSWANQQLRMTDLTRSMEFGTPPTVLKKVSILTEKELIAFKDNPCDKRSRTIFLTDAGERYLDERAKLFKLVVRAAFQ